MRIRWTDTEGYVRMLNTGIYVVAKGAGYRPRYVEQIDVNNTLGACLGHWVIDDQSDWAKCFFFFRFML